MSKEKIYLVTDPDGDKFAFDTENAAKKFITKQIKNCDMLEGVYIDYISNLMLNEPDTTLPSYYDYVDAIINETNDLTEYEYYIEDLIIITEDDIT